MKVSHRLYLTVVPALIGVAVVAGLAYWGEYERRVPPIVLAVATVATLITLAIAWFNARYISQRVERLAGVDQASSVSLRGIASAVAPGHIRSTPDELDTIESVVDRLSSAVAVAESSRQEQERVASDRDRDYATLMSTVAQDVAKQLEEVRLSLHILLDNKFGDLNENQEEILETARKAADSADTEVIAMHELAELERGHRGFRSDRVNAGDIVRSIVPTLQAIAEKHGVALHVEIEPLLPAIMGDQSRLQEALSHLLGGAVMTAKGNELALSLAKEPPGLLLKLAGAGEVPRSVRSALASRRILAMGGRVDRSGGELRVLLGIDSPLTLT